eukprot:364706-Chlamydomonas_euryale.AAC.3
MCTRTLALHVHAHTGAARARARYPPRSWRCHNAYTAASRAPNDRRLPLESLPVRFSKQLRQGRRGQWAPKYQLLPKPFTVTPSIRPSLLPPTSLPTPKTFHCHPQLPHPSSHNTHGASQSRSGLCVDSSTHTRSPTRLPPPPVPHPAAHPNFQISLRPPPSPCGAPQLPTHPPPSPHLSHAAHPNCHLISLRPLPPSPCGAPQLPTHLPPPTPLPHAAAAPQSPTAYMLAAACVMIPTVWLPDLKALSYLGFFGVSATLTCVLSVVYTFLTGSYVAGAATDPALFATLPLVFGIMTFCYSGHGVFPSIQASMAKPSEFPG